MFQALFTMRGGATQGLSIGGSCLRPIKPVQGAKWTQSTSRSIIGPRYSKVSIISQHELDLRTRKGSNETRIQTRTYEEVLADGWGPSLIDSCNKLDQNSVGGIELANTKENEHDKGENKQGGNAKQVCQENMPVSKHGGWEQHLKDEAKKMGLPSNTYLGGLKGGSPQDSLKLSNTFKTPEETNLCFVNAAFQAFACLPVFQDYFLNIDSKQTIGKPITQEVMRILLSRGSVMSLSNLRKLVGDVNNRPYGSAQEDCHEFMIYFLEALKKEGHHTLVSKFDSGTDRICKKFKTETGNCPTCLRLPTGFTQQQRFTMMLIDTPMGGAGQKIGLQTIINRKYKIISDIEEMKCSGCCECEGSCQCVKYKGTEQITLVEAPQILIVTLQSKTGVIVVPDDEIKLLNQSYKLRSCVNHEGRTRSDGHYTAIVHDGEKFLVVDDAKPARPIIRMASDKNYMYVYENVGVSAPTIDEQVKARYPDFVPTYEWQEIKEYHNVPGGLHYQMDLKTGKKYAKLNQDKVVPHTTNQEDMEDIYISDDDSDDESMLATEDESIYISQLPQNSLVNILFEGDLNKMNDNMKQNVLKYFNFPLIKGWQVTSCLRKYFETGSSDVQSKISHVIERFLCSQHQMKRVASVSEFRPPQKKTCKGTVQ